MGVLSTEGWPECVHRCHCTRVDLRLELAGDGHVDGGAEEVLGVVHASVCRARDPPHHCPLNFSFLNNLLGGCQLLERGLELGLGLSLSSVVRRRLYSVLHPFHLGSNRRRGSLELRHPLVRQRRLFGDGISLGEEGGDLEHLARTLTVARRDDGRVHVLKAALLEELVRGEGEAVADALDGSDGVGAAAEVDFLPQELQAEFGLGHGVGAGLTMPQMQDLRRV
mmetsp:Transcript_10783/g.21639  ORF Transcript_10783/g.21639 Transcript_10783/m.21639 type:complete len:224 (+) Transcript_10783:1164-1835(+)